MKFIDNKGRIFGLINYIDLAIILLIFAVAGSLLYTRLNNDSNDYLTGNEKINEEIRFDFFIQSVKDISVESVQVGDIFRIEEHGNAYSEVVDKRVEPATMITTNQNGKAIESEVPGRYNIILTIKSNGTVSNTEIKIANDQIHIGKSLTVKSKLNKFEGIVYGIDY